MVCVRFGCETAVDGAKGNGANNAYDYNDSTLQTRIVLEAVKWRQRLASYIYVMFCDGGIDEEFGKEEVISHSTGVKEGFRVLL